MHWTRISTVLASASLALAAQEAQTPLSQASGPVAGDAKAPPYRSKLLSLLESLVSIPSSDPEEEQVGLFLAEYLAKEGFTVKLQNLPPRPESDAGATSRFNIVAWLGEPEITKKVLVTSHIDVVPPYIPWEIEDGRISRDTAIKGRGSADAKGSVAAMVVAVQQLLASNKDVNVNDLMLLFVVGEETRGDGMTSFSQSLDAISPRPEFGSVIFGEPTENKLACGHKGGLVCSLQAKGKAGHSGYPELGKSANELMVRAWAKILDADLGSSTLFGNTTINIGRFDGGVAANVIPANAFVDFAGRVASGSERDGHNEVKRKIQAILDEVDEEAFTLTCTHEYGPYMCNCDVQGFETMVANYGTDIPNLQGNHARYLYGPGSILVAHGDGEKVTVGDLEDAVEGFQKLILHALEQ